MRFPFFTAASLSLISLDTIRVCCEHHRNVPSFYVCLTVARVIFFFVSPCVALAFQFEPPVILYLQNAVTIYFAFKDISASLSAHDSQLADGHEQKCSCSHLYEFGNPSCTLPWHHPLALAPLRALSATERKRTSFHGSRERESFSARMRTARIHHRRRVIITTVQRLLAASAVVIIRPARKITPRARGRR